MTDKDLELEKERNLAMQGCSTMVDLSSGVKDNNMRAAFRTNAIWKGKEQLTVGFLPWYDVNDIIYEKKMVYDPKQKKNVEVDVRTNPLGVKKIVKADDWMKKWVIKTVSDVLQPLIGIQFVFDLNEDNAENCDIRITFNRNNGAYSLVGKESLNKGSTLYKESMNLGFIDPPGKSEGGMQPNKTSGKGTFVFQGGEVVTVPPLHTQNYGNDKGATIVHEFGHALGMIHEHLNPRQLRFLFDIPKLYAKMAMPPNGWKKQQTDSNVLNLENLEEITASKFDDLSIMKYSYSPDLLFNIDLIDQGQYPVFPPKFPPDGIEIKELVIDFDKDLKNVSNKTDKNYTFLLARILANRPDLFINQKSISSTTPSSTTPVPETYPYIKKEDVENGSIFVNFQKLNYPKTKPEKMSTNYKGVDVFELLDILNKYKGNLNSVKSSKGRLYNLTDYKNAIIYLLDNNFTEILNPFITINDLINDRVRILKPENVIKSETSPMKIVSSRKVLKKAELDAMTINISEFRKLLKNILLDQMTSLSKINTELSETDKEWLKMQYPGKAPKTLIKVPGKDETVEFNTSDKAPKIDTSVIPKSTKKFTFNLGNRNVDMPMSAALSQTEADNINIASVNDKSSSGGMKKWIIIILVVILLCVGLFFGYRYYKNRNSTKSTKSKK